MKKSILFIVILMVIIPAFGQNDVTNQERLKWWREALFGMFIHWDMSSVA